MWLRPHPERPAQRIVATALLLFLQTLYPFYHLG
jgi:hypothetical protein